MGRTGKAKGGRQFDAEFQTPVFLTADNLKPFLPKDIAENSTPILFTHSGTRLIGYPAELLPQVCEVFLDALEAGALRPNQLHIAERCKILHRGVDSPALTLLSHAVWRLAGMCEDLRASGDPGISAPSPNKGESK